MTKLPKDLAAERDELANDYWDDNIAGQLIWRKENPLLAFKSGFDAGATAVLESEELKKLEAALYFCAHNIQYDTWEAKEVSVKALTEFRAWKGQSHE